MTAQIQHSPIGTGATQPNLVPCSRRTHEADVTIVGAGLSGALAAVVLGRAGYRVALLDRYPEYPPEFRVEKIGGNQVDMLRRLDLLDSVASVSTAFDQVVNARHGRIIDVTNNRHYGIFYNDFVNVIRAQLPPTVDFIAGQVVDVKASAQRQQVVLADGSSVESRLIVVATGLADALRHKLGVRRRTAFEKHSISFGFSIEPEPGNAFEFRSLTYYGEQVADRIDYLSVFPIGQVTRANLFTFRDHRDRWIRDLRHEPEAALLATMPGLQRFLGNFRVVGKVHHWVMDLYAVDNHLCDGAVLIGDAFQTSCPAAGTGVSRLLTDVHQLCRVHVPRWLASPGMQRDKIAQFYSDPVKQKEDRRSLYLAGYRRSLTTDDSWPWQARRCQAFLRRRAISWIKDLKTA